MKNFKGLNQSLGQVLGFCAISASLVGLTLVTSGCGISSPNTGVTLANSGASVGLTINPSSVSNMAAGSTHAFSAWGGSGTGYTFSKISGVGIIDPTTGVYTAPSSVTTGPSTAVVQVTDSVGLTKTATISLATSGTSAQRLTVSVASSVVLVNQTTQITASGGTAPYAYRVSGGGSIEGSGRYTAPSTLSGTEQAVTMTVTDSAGISAAAPITVTQVAVGSTAFVGFFTSLDVGQSIAGTVPVEVSVYKAYNSDVNAAYIKVVLELPNGNRLVVGTQNLSAGGASVSLNTSSYPNGDYILHLSAFDSNSVEYTEIADPLAVKFSNLSAQARAQCTTQGGTAVVANGRQICQIPSSACPVGWIAYGSGHWTTTVATFCDGGSSTGCRDGRKSDTTGFHDTFQDLAPETVTVPEVAACGPANSGRNRTCTATITKIGCVLRN